VVDCGTSRKKIRLSTYRGLSSGGSVWREAVVVQALIFYGRQKFGRKALAKGGMARTRFL
jgi:hypothetical protein